MKDLKEFVNNTNITEKLRINKNIQITDARNDTERFMNNWQWFNMLVTNVKLEEDQYSKMFSNLSDQEIKVWIKEVQDCYSGTEQEDDAMNIKDSDDLATFYYENPVTE